MPRDTEVSLTTRTKPQVQDAPGLVWRFRKNRWVAYWQARSDLVKRGYAPGAVRLWEGEELNEVRSSKIASQCRKHQSVMLTWGRKRAGSKPLPLATPAPTTRTKRPEYNVWESMLTRCRNPRHHTYPPYGGKGISVCERWFDFDNFYEDMGPRPQGYWIERRDGKGNYEPENCHWASPWEQNDNRNSTFMVEFRGEKLSLRRAHKLAKSPADYRTVYTRVTKMGWDLERALTAKSQRRKSA